MDNTTRSIQEEYGFCTNLTVSFRDSDVVVRVEGTEESGQVWMQLLSVRAAHVLWFKLTALLYPEQAQTVTALAATAPLRSSLPFTVTTHVEAVREDQNGLYAMVGWTSGGMWTVWFAEQDARLLWTLLDEGLYPVGWEGREWKRTAR
jgi:hypothetical protein